MLQIHPFGPEFFTSWDEFIALVTDTHGRLFEPGVAELRLRHRSVNEEVVEIQYLLTFEDPDERYDKWPIDVTEESLRARLHRLEQRLTAAELILDGVEKGDLPAKPPDVATGRAGIAERPVEEQYALAVATLVVVQKRTFRHLHELEKAVGERVHGYGLGNGTLSKALERVVLNGKPLYCKAPPGAAPQRRHLALRQTIDHCIAWCRAQHIELPPPAST